MRAWIDTEFNSYKGELISMAIVVEDGREWYVNLGCANPDPWVAEHVMPILNAPVTSREDAQRWLDVFLRRYPQLHLIADWPEDLAHFCQFLITGPGTRIDTPVLTMAIDRELEAPSLLPHNALEDARAMRKAYGIECSGQGALF